MELALKTYQEVLRRLAEAEQALLKLQEEYRAAHAELNLALLKDTRG